MADQTATEEKPPEPLRSVHTPTFPELLRNLGISVLVTTYQAGKLVVLREEDGVLNTRFRTYHQPMGLALAGPKLALGTRREVWDFRNQPDAARRLKPEGKHDACFLPRAWHQTGNIGIHELAWGSDDLWLVNTRFSCLCTLDRHASFVPRWRPPFVSILAPDDRCHLNGVGMAPDESGAVYPRFVTCLGETDTPAGWRANKTRGGCLIDVLSGKLLSRGLSMPHSPRWYNGQLWVLESGDGSIATVDWDTGKLQVVAQLPGFTRGLDFFGPYAFIGLSQVRETAAFSGIPITERLPVEERSCGVWVVDVRSGQTVALLKFEDAVQEVFAVQVLPGIRYPEINTDDEDILNNTFALPGAVARDVVRPGRVPNAQPQ